MELLVALIFIIPFLFVVCALTAVFNGWILSTLWNWFLPEVFSLPLLDIPTAIGVSLVVSCFTYAARKSDPAEDATKAVLTLFLGKLMLLLVGYIVKFYFM